MTTNDRSSYANGLANGGSVIANWQVLTPYFLVAANGATLTRQPDSSLLASGGQPGSIETVYTVSAYTTLTNITGFRLEALSDPSLPDNGPGRTFLGTFVLQDFQVSASASAPGAVVAWGTNNAGQTNVPLSAQSGIVAIAAGTYITAALKNDGSVISWGTGVPSVPPAAQSDVIAVAAGFYQMAALKSDGSVVVWGNNTYGQMNIPIEAQTGVKAIATAGGHVVALKRDGTVVAWGYNGDGQTNVPAGLSGVTAIAAGDINVVALKSDGSVVVWGDNGAGQLNVPIGAQSGVSAIAAGGGQILALKSDGVVAWGYNGSGESTVPVAAQSGVTAIAAGGSHSVALKSDGSVVAWGENSGGQINVPAAAQSGVTAISAGGAHTVALMGTGAIAPSITVQPANKTVNVGRGVNLSVAVTGMGPVSYQWRKNGTNLPGVIGSNYSLGLARMEHAGTYTVVASNAGGSVLSAPAVLTVYPATPGTAVAWGLNVQGESTVPIDALSGVVAISTKQEHSLALKNDGTVVAWGNNIYGETNVPVGAKSGATAIAMGGVHAMVLKNDGSVVAWGNNDYGQRNVPVAAQAGVMAIEAGIYHSLALKNDGAVVAWGFNDFGESTVPVAAQSGVVAIAAGFHHSLALKNDGTVVVWGQNIYGQAEVPPEAQGQVVAISSQLDNNLALKSDGSVVYWGGHNGFGFQPVPLAAQSGVIAIAAGLGHSVALKTDGTVVTWGNNDFGQTAVPFQAASSVTAVTAGYRQSVVIVSTLAPVITVQPLDRSAAIGETVSLNVQAAGGEPLFYQWKLSGVDIANATNASLVLANIQSAQEGSYSVVVTNYLGATASAAATVNVLSPPQISVPPAGQTASKGDNVTFMVSANGAPPLTYQWRLNGVNIPGATSSTYSVFDVRATNAGVYTVVVANPVGAAISTGAKLLLRSDDPSALKDSFANRITTNHLASGEVEGNNLSATKETGEPNHAGQPGGKSVWYAWTAPGDGPVTFKTAGSGFDTLLAIYVGNSVNGLTEVASNDDLGGFYSSSVTFRATNNVTYQIAVDGFGGASGDIHLEWEFNFGPDDIPKFLVQPQSQTVTNGATVEFTVSIGLRSENNRSQLGYQWYRDGQPLSGATATNLVLANVQTNNIGAYQIVVTVSNNIVGKIFPSAYATLEIQRTDINQSADPARQSHDKFLDLFAGGSSGPTTFSRLHSPRPFGVTVAAGVLGTQILNNFGATTEPDEPLIAGRLGGASRWFSIEAAENGVMVVDTIGSDFDTLLGVYTGTSLFTLTEVASDNNSAPDSLRSLVSFPVISGTTYLIAVDGINGAQGTVSLNWKLGVPPTVLQPPLAQSVSAAGTVTLNASSMANPAPTYQWRFNGVDIYGATNATLTLDNFRLEQQGSYSVVTKNLVGFTVSPSAFVALDIPAQLGSAIRYPDGSFRFQLTGTARRDYVIQTTTNLAGRDTIWKSVMTNSDYQGTFYFLENSTIHGKQFYRATVP